MSSPLCATAWLSLPIAILPSGTSTAAVMPACAAYAAAEADVLPVDAQMTAFAPCSIARETATVMPRSLNEPVGFMPSNFTHTSAPVRRDSAGAGSSGVPPSPRVTTVEASVTPRRSAYSRRTPRQTCAISVSFHAQHRDDAFDDAARGETVDGVAEVLLQGLVGSDDEAGDVVASSAASTVCSTVAIETRPSLRMPATVASTPGWSSTSSVIWYRVVTRPIGTIGRFARVDSPTPTPPAMWRRAAETTSPSTADAVCTPPAPAP